MPRLAIDSHYLTEQLKALLNIPSPTGYTDTIVRHVSRELERLGLPVELTRRGGIRALRQGARRESARAVVSHVDTLGAQVKAPGLTRDPCLGAHATGATEEENGPADQTMFDDLEWIPGQARDDEAEGYG